MMDLFSELAMTRSAPLKWLRDICEGQNVLAAGRFSAELLETIDARGTAVVSRLGGTSCFIGNRATAIEPAELLKSWEGHSVILLSEAHWSGYIIHEVEALCTMSSLLNATLIMPCVIRADGLASKWSPDFAPTTGTGDNCVSLCENQTASLTIDMRGTLTSLWLVGTVVADETRKPSPTMLSIYINGEALSTVSTSGTFRIELPRTTGLAHITFDVSGSKPIDAKNKNKLPYFGILGVHIIDATGGVIVTPDRLHKSTAYQANPASEMTLDEMFWRSRLHATGFYHVDIIASDQSGNVVFELGESCASMSSPTPLSPITASALQAARIKTGVFTWLVARASAPRPAITDKGTLHHAAS